MIRTRTWTWATTTGPTGLRFGDVAVLNGLGTVGPALRLGAGLRNRPGALRLIRRLAALGLRGLGLAALRLRMRAGILVRLG